jgi:type II secretory pathway pseudopilin PulG
MLRRRFWHRSARRPAQAGFTLLDLLVGVAIASVVILAIGTAVILMTQGWTDQQARLQAQQSLRAAVADISREVRLAGACMLPYWTGTAPPATFQPLDGTHNGTTDTIVVRWNPTCAQATLTSACNQCGSIPVDNVTNFQPTTWAYLHGTSQNQYFLIRSITGNTLNVDPSTPVTANYATGTSVYGVEQWTFAISSTCSGCGGSPTLTLQTLSVPQTPLVKGIESLSIQYILNRTYASGTCNGQTGGTPNLCIVNLPGSGTSPASDWQLVRVVTFNIGARSTSTVWGAGTSDGLLRLTEYFEIAPRNFVFNQQNGGRL